MENSNIKGIHHVCIKVNDLQKSTDFYIRQMGYSLLYKWDGGAMLMGQDGTRLEFFPEDSESGYVHVAYACEDVDKAYHLALQDGCESDMVPTDTKINSEPPRPVRIAFIKDHCGNKIELFHEYHD